MPTKKNPPQVWKSLELSGCWRRSLFNLQPLVWQVCILGAGAAAVALVITAWLADRHQRGSLRQSRTIICSEAAVRGLHDCLWEHPGGTSRLTVSLWSCRQDGRAKRFAQCDGLLEKCGKCCEDTAITRGSNIWLWFRFPQCEIQWYKLRVGLTTVFFFFLNRKSILKRKEKKSRVEFGGCAAAHVLRWEHRGAICANDWPFSR